MIRVPGFHYEPADGYVDSASALQDFVMVGKNVLEFAPAGSDV